MQNSFDQNAADTAAIHAVLAKYYGVLTNMSQDDVSIFCNFVM